MAVPRIPIHPVRALLLIVAVTALATPAAQAASTTGGPVVRSIALDTTIDPASADWIKQSLDSARDDGVGLVIVRLDTPGGLDDSMRDIIKRILAAPMPVVVYVSPNGGRAASAGLYITESADVAAMAPQTNIGSATPINIGPGNQDRVLGRKIRNDASAYVRALAQGHGRNPDLAEQMVRKATNVTAAEALSSHLIDVVASDQQDLLRQLDGFRARGPKAQVLHTAGAKLEIRDRPFKFQVLGYLVNPSISFLLLILGLLGIGFEIFHPGAILPGALGGVSLILSLFGLAQLPLNAAGLLLIGLGVALLIAEAHIASHGALGAAGIVALVGGGLLMFNTGSSALSVSAPVAIFTAVLLGGFFAFVATKAVTARHRHVQTGWEELLGETAEVRSRLDPVGQVFVRGALWRATTGTGTALERGDRVVIDHVDGLTLTVHKEE